AACARRLPGARPATYDSAGDGAPSGVSISSAPLRRATASAVSVWGFEVFFLGILYLLGLICENWPSHSPGFEETQGGLRAKGTSPGWGALDRGRGQGEVESARLVRGTRFEACVPALFTQGTGNVFSGTEGTPIRLGAGVLLLSGGVRESLMRQLIEPRPRLVDQTPADVLLDLHVVVLRQVEPVEAVQRSTHSVRIVRHGDVAGGMGDTVSDD